jgi:sulfoxide reductase catalytic subunit YedY
MANLILPPDWQLSEKEAIDPYTYRSRRAFLKTLGLGSIGLGVVPGALAACTGDPRGAGSTAVAGRGPLDTIPSNAPRTGLPPTINEAFKVPERPVTDRVATASYNNFYEFDSSSKEIWHLTDEYEPFPMTLEVDGLVEKSFTVDVEQLIREFGLEQRTYRFRCVEAWSMTVPWVGFPLAKLVERCKPLSSATHVAFVSLNRPEQMPGIKKASWFPWPYYEGLRMDEATNELAFVVTGAFGEPLPKQNGSPIRLALPWKYGYKGPKAIQKISFTNKQPKTFWNDLYPNEYSFLSNVNPNVPHPRWSQASERFIQSIDDVQRIPTQLFNGYADWVGDLYPKEPRG